MITKEEYMTLCAARWEEIDELSARTNLYDLEKDFVDIWQGLGRSVFEQRVSAAPQNHRKKKFAK
jgi:hypothetical protein